MDVEQNIPEKYKEKENDENFVSLRNETIKQINIELEKRERENPNPTNDEVRIGAFTEAIEPQVRSAVAGMYKKGYRTFSSGFRGGKHPETQFIKGKFRLDDETRRLLKAKGVEVQIFRREEDPEVFTGTAISFESKEADIEKIESEWEEIVKMLPDLGKPEVSTNLSAIAFREKYCPQDNDIRIKAIRKILNEGAAPKWSRVFNALLIKDVEKRKNELEKLYSNKEF